ncbi:MAG: glycosyltransferase [Planctomycetota bacterium]|nr:glycosyltransferase [Planctomycetota bacterium]
MAETPVKLSIVVPVRHEGPNLTIMFRLLNAVLEIPFEVLVVYDSPDDQTIEYIEAIQRDHSHLRGILNTFGRGVINAFKAGVQDAKGDWVLIFAADEVGPILALDSLLALMDQGCDFVSCTRYAYGGRRLGGSRIGHLLSKTANWWFQVLAGCVMTDATTGIKIFRREIFEKLELSSNPVGWAVAFEMAIKAQMLGLKIGEAPIISIDRLFGGQSTFRLGSWVKGYSRWFYWGIKTLRGSTKKMYRKDVLRIRPQDQIPFTLPPPQDSDQGMTEKSPQ